MRDLKECMGEEHYKIRKWISIGWVRDGVQGTQCRNGHCHDIHRFCEKEILNFIKARPQEINLGKIDQMWYLDLILLKGMTLRKISATFAVTRVSSDEEW